eukprot:2831069-Prymnesium_polylepis.1
MRTQAVPCAQARYTKVTCAQACSYPLIHPFPQRNAVRRSDLLCQKCVEVRQIRGRPRLRTSDEPSVRIGLRSDLGAGELE